MGFCIYEPILKAGMDVKNVEQEYDTFDGLVSMLISLISKFYAGLTFY